MKLYKRSNYFSCGARVQGEEATLADLKAALKEHGMVAVPVEPTEAMIKEGQRSTPGVTKLDAEIIYEWMIKTAEEE